ncbi:MAG: Asp-tRNA(Asn)/Glu-tRNA(Gln) amidotransferase subunit GatB [Polyangiaceae bacterium]|nr:Asp-tRNA(Asn)/Glu-tRNA(Gln) amidotransferase subunit GatB [Polyangiaceae bacterium]
MSARWETVVGLEVHAQLLTRTKLFCGCPTSAGAPPNVQVCAVCLGLPGALPAANREAIVLGVRAALALGLTVHEESVFARKSYFYPDLPKGYQISQFERPLATGGQLDLETSAGPRRVTLQRLHLEEDAGKSVHGHGGDSLVDLNRAGVPLAEIVSAPDLRSGEEAATYLRALRDVLVFQGVNDGNLESGSFRCDANVSVRRQGSDTLGTRVELKNLNSFRFVQRAIEAEARRQVALLEAGAAVDAETRSYDPEADRTASLRGKEEAHDYRYFPDPDLPPLRVDEALLEAARAGLGESPAALRARWTEGLGVPAAAARTLASHPRIAEFFQRALALGADARRAAAWIPTEVLRGAEIDGLAATFRVTPEQVTELLALVEEGVLSGKQAKDLQLEVEGTDASPRAIAEGRGLRVVADEAALAALCDELIAGAERQVAAYRKGQRGVLGWFVGQAMQRTRGAADPRLVTRLLTERLDKPAS